MNILIIGSGGREHSLGLALKKSKNCDSVFFAPGNTGTAKLGQNLAISETDFSALIKAVKRHSIELTLVGPEGPLVNGIVDHFESHNLTIMGPNKIAAQLEGSKAWAKDKMKSYNIPTAAYETFTEFNDAKSYIESRNVYPIVIKADGLAAGKGVTVATSYDIALNALTECFLDQKFSQAGLQVVIEDFLVGEEASILAFTDGETIIAMPPAQDHKAVFDADKGPNTGGMGAYCPAPIATPEIQEQVLEKVLKPLINGFKKDGILYKGIVYAGLMIAPSGQASVVEFNARFGDPETEVILPKLKTDLIDIFLAVINGTLHHLKIEWDNTTVVGVIMASGGYPGDFEKEKEISGIEAAEEIKNVSVIHAGTKEKNNRIVTNGGRVLCVLGQGNTIQDAIKIAYTGVDKISFKNQHYRTDIGKKAI
ncbi:MAG: phosphoribosylamine--glycine ligase [Candidatus Margulisbacteria bacterium]|nr:phosphoribosylamine--glycine ligase [Candidatus Margulisiibacteriota bacterium]